MNFKRSTTSMGIVLMTLSLVSMTSIQQDAFAQSLGMSLTATADKGSDTITVTGKTISDITDITFTVTSPNQKLVSVDQITADGNGDFAATFKISPAWTENGFYEIQAMQGVGTNSLYTMKVLVEVANGMAERTSVTESNLETGIFTPTTNNVATPTGITLDNVTAENGSTMFEVTGMTDRVSQDITLTITSPSGNVITVDQISPMLDGSFAAEITVGGPLWKQDGFYTVVAQQFDDPLYSASDMIEIEDGVVVPEFGTIAAMILAVAVISIIAVSAKSRLSIIPRY